ncbi:MAG: phosphoglycerate dehydrogenase-like enzyme [Loktanella salsilacus]|jgi:phosphoglycerate dehydrogenase-like enzyme|uniref:D-2-hydroxyacid dehydrogenase family protein n=1 Tax=Loktanella salsilacus TaxID=195913 RepID=UPI003988CA5A
MKIAVLDDYALASPRLADWSGLGDVTVFQDTITGTDLVDRLRPFDVICLMRERTPMGADLIAQLPNLRLIVTSGPRNASIDLPAARAAGITVCGTQSRKTTTSELTTLMMLALNRRLLPEVANLSAGGWQSGLGRDVAGLTLGLIGLGNIGAQMAVIGKALGMDIVAWSPNLTQVRCTEFGVARAESLTDLMARADVASVHMVLSDRSRGLVDAAAFAAAKQGQVFINTSRGPLVDTGALLDGLRAGKPAMAGLDVFDVEPLPLDDPLRDADLIASGQLLLTPHLGYTTEATFRLFYTQTVEAIRAYQAGTPIREL